MLPIKKELIDRHHSLASLITAGLPYRVIKQFSFPGREITPAQVIGSTAHSQCITAAAGELMYTKYTAELKDYERYFQNSVRVHMLPAEYRQKIVWGVFLTQCAYYNKICAEYEQRDKPITKFPKLSIQAYQDKFALSKHERA